MNLKDLLLSVLLLSLSFSPFSFDSPLYLILRLHHFFPRLLRLYFVLFYFDVFSVHQAVRMICPFSVSTSSPSGQHQRPQPLQYITTPTVNFDLSAIF